MLYNNLKKLLLVIAPLIVFANFSNASGNTNTLNKYNSLKTCIKKVQQNLVSCQRPMGACDVTSGYDIQVTEYTNCVNKSKALLGKCLNNN